MYNPYVVLRNKWRHRTRATRTAIKLTILAECLMALFLYLGFKDCLKDFLDPQFVLASYHQAITPAPMPKEVLDTINYYSKLFGIEPSLAIKITTCESQNRTEVIGNEPRLNLNSIGLWQFQPATFYENATKYKMRNANLYDWRDQTILAIQMLRDKKCSAWACCPFK